MSPQIIETVTIDDESRNENCSPESTEMQSPKGGKSRILYCRKCEGHGLKVILKNHSPQCPYILCDCKSCSKLNVKRLKSFNKRNKDKIELAAALNAKRHASENSQSTDDDEGTSRRSSFCSKTSSPGMDAEIDRKPTPSGLEPRAQSLGNAQYTVMSYDIWKAKCAMEKKRLEEERGKKISFDSNSSSLASNMSPSGSPTPFQRKRAHTYMGATPKREEEIPIVAPKKMSVDEKGKGKLILLPTIPAMRIFVNEEEDEKKAMPVLAAPQPIHSSFDIPSTSTALRSFQVPPTSLPRPSPVLPPMMSPFKPVVQQHTTPSPVLPVTTTTTPMPSTITPQIGNMTNEQLISSLTLHNTVMRHHQNNQMMQMINLGGAPQQQSDDLFRLQQTTASLIAALQASGINLPPLQAATTPMPVTTTTTPLPPPQQFQTFVPKPIIPSTTQIPLLNPFLLSHLYTNPV